MTRRLFTIASAVSLVLFLATAVLWVRSYWRIDAVCLSRWREYSLSSADGAVSFQVKNSVRSDWMRWVRPGQISPSGTSEPFGSQWSISHLGQLDLPRIFRWDTDRGALGIAYRDGSEFWGGDLGVSYGIRYRVIVLPFWLLTLVAIAPASPYVLLKTRSAHRARRGLCRSCGYDLRATPTRCPECGAPVPKRSTVQVTA